jgi:uncharacterized protein YggE
MFVGVDIGSGPRFRLSREDELRRESTARAAADAKGNTDALLDRLTLSWARCARRRRPARVMNRRWSLT